MPVAFKDGLTVFYSTQPFFSADTEGPDQTAQMRSLIRAFAVHMWPQILFSLERPILTSNL